MLVRLGDLTLELPAAADEARLVGRLTAMTDVVLLDVSERIATITLNRPEARNALSQRGAAARCRS